MFRIPTCRHMHSFTNTFSKYCLDSNCLAAIEWKSSLGTGENQTREVFDPSTRPFSENLLLAGIYASFQSTPSLVPVGVVIEIKVKPFWAQSSFFCVAQTRLCRLQDIWDWDFYDAALKGWSLSSSLPECLIGELLSTEVKMPPIVAL